MLGIYFQGGSPNAKLVRGLRHVHDKFEGGATCGRLEVIYISAAATQEDFSKTFREMPWLAIPFVHAQRRARLRELFEVSPETNQVVLIDPEGRTITRDGATPIELAAACQAALDNKAKKELEFDAEFKSVDVEKTKLVEMRAQLNPCTDTARRKSRSSSSPHIFAIAATYVLL